MKYYFITGSSRGIGNALVSILIRKSDTYVTGISRSESLKGSNYRHFALDLSDIDLLNEQKLSELFPLLQDADELVLINNAATLGEIGYVGELSAAHYSSVFTLNVTAAAVLMEAFVKQYQRVNCRKVIVNISSGAGKRPIDGWGAYCASKAALDMLSEVAAKELALRADVTRVFSISPGVVDTAMQSQIREADESRFSSVAQFKSLYAKQELQDPSEVARKLLAFIEQEKYPSEVQIRL